MRLIIAGSRSFADYNLLEQKVDYVISNYKGSIEIVSGTAIGADRLGERYAKSKGYPIKRFPADWDKYGKRAGYIRNLEMAEYATNCICFWDGVSRGTESMIEICKSKNIPYRVIITL